MRHNPGTSNLPVPTLGGFEPLVRSQTFVVADNTSTTTHEYPAPPVQTFVPMYDGIQDRTYDRIRKWKLEFNGEADPIDFVERIEELARSQRIPLDEVPATLSESLKDSALSWWRNRRHEWSSWATFRRSFLRYFLPTNFWEDLDDSIRGRRQREDEPFKEYALALETLTRHTHYDALQKLERIYKNSLPAIKLLIKRREFESLDELTALVSHVELTRGSIGPRTPLTLREVEHHLYPKPRPPHRPSGQMESAGATRTVTPTTKPRPAENTVPTLIANPSEACRRCGRAGHFSQKCQNPVQLLCWTCGKTNIRTKECCPTSRTKLGIIRAQNMTHPEMTLSLKVSNPLNNGRSFKCTIHVEARAYPAIIDTGSCQSYISGKVWQELPRHAYRRQPCQFNLVFADGTNGRVDSSLAVKYEFQGKPHQGSLLILERSMDLFILGMDFLNTVGVSLHLGNSSKSDTENIPLRLKKLHTPPESPDQQVPPTLTSEPPRPESVIKQPPPEPMDPEQIQPESTGLEQPTPELGVVTQDQPGTLASELFQPGTDSSEQQLPTRPEPEHNQRKTTCKDDNTTPSRKNPPDNPEIPEYVRKFLREEIANSENTRAAASVGTHRLCMKDDIPIKQLYYPRKPSSTAAAASGSVTSTLTASEPHRYQAKETYNEQRGAIAQKFRSTTTGKQRIPHVRDWKIYDTPPEYELSAKH